MPCIGQVAMIYECLGRCAFVKSVSHVTRVDTYRAKYCSQHKLVKVTLCWSGCKQEVVFEINLVKKKKRKKKKKKKGTPRYIVLS
jgi:hypothetical protein